VRIFKEVIPANFWINIFLAPLVDNSIKQVDWVAFFILNNECKWRVNINKLWGYTGCERVWCIGYDKVIVRLNWQCNLGCKINFVAVTCPCVLANRCIVLGVVGIKIPPWPKRSVVVVITILVGSDIDWQCFVVRDDVVLWISNSIFSTKIKTYCVDICTGCLGEFEIISAGIALESTSINDTAHPGICYHVISSANFSFIIVELDLVVAVDIVVWNVLGVIILGS